MTLDELKKGDSAVIKKINAENELRNRLVSFGVKRNSSINVKEYSIAKKTVKIEINRAMIALRLDEARKIEVEASC